MLNSGVSQATVQLRQWYKAVCSAGNNKGSRKLYSTGDNCKESLLGGGFLEVPKGFIAVYVREDEDQRRFLIPTSYLSMPEFRVLMDEAAEEFGFNQEGPLHLPCQEPHFHRILLKCSKTKSTF